MAMIANEAPFDSPVLQAAIARCQAAVFEAGAKADHVTVRAIDLALVAGFALGTVMRERERARAEREFPS